MRSRLASGASATAPGKFKLCLEYFFLFLITYTHHPPYLFICFSMHPFPSPFTRGTGTGTH